MIQHYYSDEHVTLYHGRMEEVMQDFGENEWADACLTDPPYGETSLEWDRWPKNWPLIVSWSTNSMWCFGSMRMFLDQRDQFRGWKLSQDVVWRKQMGTGLSRDRFRRVHEFALHFYTGPWSDIYHNVPKTARTGPNTGRRVKGGSKGAHLSEAGNRSYVDDGTRLMTSVIQANNMHRRAIHPTEKPAAILAPLIEYSVPPGGLVLDPFAGSASTLLTARQLGRRAVGIEANEEYCEKAAERLSIPDLFGGAA